MPGGRPRKPAPIKILEGTFRADRDTPGVIADGTPTPPASLKGDALRLWGEIVPGLVARGVANACDEQALALMVRWLAMAHRYTAAAEKMALSNKGLPRMANLAATATSQFDRIAARFGLTPSDRAKLRADPNAKAASKVASRKRG